MKNITKREVEYLTKEIPKTVDTLLTMMKLMAKIMSELSEVVSSIPHETIERAIKASMEEKNKHIDKSK